MALARSRLFTGDIVHDRGVVIGDPPSIFAKKSAVVPKVVRQLRGRRGPLGQRCPVCPSYPRNLPWRPEPPGPVIWNHLGIGAIVKGVALGVTLREVTVEKWLKPPLERWFLRQSLVPTTPFLDPSIFEWVAPLEKAWLDIREESAAAGSSFG